jgi:hypothetical protein
VKVEFRTFGLWCRYTPVAARLFLRHQAKAFLAAPEKAMAKDWDSAPAADRKLMDDPETHQMLLESQREAWANGPQGVETGGTLHLSPDDGHLLVFSRWDDFMGTPAGSAPPA